MKISACIITYNHEAYIRECLDGAISQKLNCNYEIIIGEDLSTDNTLKICKEYAEKYPKIVKILPREKNLGMISNWQSSIYSCQGEYIAICEGDDYWTDPLKLQKQVDFLEANKDYSLCFHNANVIYDDIITKSHLFTKLEDRFYTGVELFDNWLIPTASVLFRKEALYSERYVEVCESSKILYADTPLFISASFCGKLFGFSETMSVYRKQAEGMTNNYLKNLFQVCIHYKEIARIFGKEYLLLAKDKVASATVLRALSLLKRGRMKEATKFLVFGLSYAPLLSLKKVLTNIK